MRSSTGGGSSTTRIAARETAAIVRHSGQPTPGSRGEMLANGSPGSGGRERGNRRLLTRVLTVGEFADGLAVQSFREIEKIWDMVPVLGLQVQVVQTRYERVTHACQAHPTNSHVDLTVE